MHVLLGLDDTDVLGHKPGTGRLARDLGAHLRDAALGTLVGVVRHQLLVDPRIPYTSHNSPACVMLQLRNGGNGALRDVFDEAARYLQARSADGSDPGLCVAPRDRVTAAIVAFGGRAASVVVTKAEAQALAERDALWLAELGGTGDGIIGALAAVGLTADGNAGRFLEHGDGLRDLGDTVPAGLLRARGITPLCVSRNGEAVPDEAMILTGNWLRPRLIGGQPVLFVEPTSEGWRCFDRKQHHDHEAVAGEP